MARLVALPFTDWCCTVDAMSASAMLARAGVVDLGDRLGRRFALPRAGHSFWRCRSGINLSERKCPSLGRRKLTI